MGLSCPPSHLSGSQSSLASETGMGSADLQGGTPPWPDPKGAGEYHTTPSNQLPPLLLCSPSPTALLSHSILQNWRVVDEIFNSLCLLSQTHPCRQ